MSRVRIIVPNRDDIARIVAACVGSIDARSMNLRHVHPQVLTAEQSAYTLDVEVEHGDWLAVVELTQEETGVSLKDFFELPLGILTDLDRPYCREPATCNGSCRREIACNN